MSEYIDKHEVIKTLLKINAHYNNLNWRENSWAEYASDGVNECIFEINQMQPVELKENKLGKWIEHHEPFTWAGYAYWTCSECGVRADRTNYCPNCGCKMERQ